jgi:two-component system cell cycle response regulator
MPTLDPQTPDRGADKPNVEILIADDDSVSRLMLAKQLTSWGYDVIAVADGAQAWRVLQKPGAPQLAILDWMMPGLTGPDLCRELRSRGREPYTYVLLLTARTERQDLIAGMESGADDYITKPFHAQELEVRLRAGRRILDLQTELVEAREALRVQATRDPLTSIWNRYAILESLGREVTRAVRERSALAVMIADLDHFKEVNDTHGHLCGDAVLREVARRMQSCLRSYDLVGRYGGEEFLLVLPASSIANAMQVGERVRAAVAAEPVRVGEISVHATVSIGATAVEGGAEATADDLIQAADAALYRAKAAGRNRVEWSGSEAEPLVSEPQMPLPVAAPLRNG